MAFTFYNGNPPDSYGSDGDGVFDYKNRFIWGPKGNVTAGSWQGTAANNTGPTGPAQLSGSGAPASSLGQSGSGYCDLNQGNTYLKANNSWSQIGNIQGPVGNTGTPLLTAFASQPNQMGALSSASLSSTPTVINCPGSTTPNYFCPVASSALTGLYAFSNAACTLTLYNTTTSQSVASFSITANSGFGGNGANYSPTTYPLVAGNVYQWQATGSATASLQMMPFYLQPAYSANIPAIGQTTLAGFSTATTFSSTVTFLPIFGQTSSDRGWVYAPTRTGGVYTAQATYWPSSGTASTASVTPVLNSFTLGGNNRPVDGRNIGISFSAVTANGQPQTLLSPRVTDSTTLSVNYGHSWSVTGSGTGVLAISLLPIV